jgi:hypothetical protein
VVVLERHTLVLGRVDLHVYVVTALTNQGGK